MMAELVTENPRGGPWYEGHFPSMPMLPAVAMLALVESAARTLLSVQIAQLRRVRFKAIVRPEATTLRVRIRGSETDAGAYEFTVEADEVLACAGTFSV
jgi:3-hydroxymyristoyl/3-hydroxydecanoyl-(acyl carrier protein) dehydratase